jgi:hypothetical protein
MLPESFSHRTQHNDNSEQDDIAGVSERALWARVSILRRDMDEKMAKTVGLQSTYPEQ